VHARLGLALCLLVIDAAPASAAETHWQRVMAGDRKVGQVEQVRSEERGVVVRTETLTLELGRAGRRFTHQLKLVTESSAEGDLLRMTRESRTREGHSLVDARVEGDDLRFDIGADPARQSRTLAGVAPLKTLEFARGWLQAVGSGALQAPLRYRSFDPVRLAVVDVELARVPVTAGPYQFRRSVRLGAAENANVAALDPNGNVIDEVIRLGGFELRLVGASEAEARAGNEPFDHVAGQMKPAPYRIPNNELRAKIRYAFDNGGRAPQLPAGGGQRGWSEDQTTWIQVCASCPVDAAPLPEEERAQALAATPWLNFQDESLTRRAQRVARSSGDADQRMQRLAAHVRGHMAVDQIDMLGYGSALEAFRTRRGDCTEFAVLLAAMGRAVGIPTRVVSGLVYARRFEGQSHVFVPHAWVQAWTGTGWQSYDAGTGRFDSTHLAFAMSYDGNPAQLFGGIALAHRLELRSAARVVPRGAAKAAP
jgi:hypothetical protein